MIVKIGYKAAFLRMLKKLPPNLQLEVKEKIILFAGQPDHVSLRTHKLQGPLKGLCSFSVNYAYRIVFEYEDKSTVVLLAVGDHDVYR